MYKIWFKQQLGVAHMEHSAEFNDRLIAQMVWDMLDGAGWYMMSQRP